MPYGKTEEFCHKKTFLDNFRIRSKLILIFVFCVIFPVILTDCIMYESLKHNAEKQQISQLNNTMERLSYNLTDEINDCISVSNYLYTDSMLYRFISKKYNGPVDYYQGYNALMHDNVIRYYYTAQSVYNIQIYTENNTITNGGNFMSLDTAFDEEWYKAFVTSGKDIFVYSYHSPLNKKLQVLGPARKISIMRYLNNFSSKGRIILKIDVAYDRLMAEMKNQGAGTDIFVSDSRNLLLSTRDTLGDFNEYPPKDSISLKSVVLSQELPIVSDKWMLYVTADEPDMKSTYRENGTMIIVLVLFNLFLPSIVIFIVNRSFSSRLQLTEKYIRKFENEEFERIECFEGKDEIGNLIRSYNLMVSKIKELIEVVFKKNSEKQALEILKKQAELNALQSQINPHFIFNTLESIRMRSLIKKEFETADIIEELAGLMRRTLQWGTDFIPIQDEMKYVENYLKIQKYRFGDTLSFSLYADENCQEVKIPKFGIVTFVENACVHGIEKTVGSGAITVAISKADNKIYIEIMDSGIGISAQKLSEIREKISNASIEMLSEAENIGILNTYIRLKIYYNDKVTCTIESKEGEGTDIRLILPMENNSSLGEGDVNA